MHHIEVAVIDKLGTEMGSRVRRAIEPHGLPAYMQHVDDPTVLVKIDSNTRWLGGPGDPDVEEGRLLLEVEGKAILTNLLPKHVRSAATACVPTIKPGSSLQLAGVRCYR